MTNTWYLISGEELEKRFKETPKPKSTIIDEAVNYGIVKGYNQALSDIKRDCGVKIRQNSFEAEIFGVLQELAGEKAGENHVIDTNAELAEKLGKAIFPLLPQWFTPTKASGLVSVKGKGEGK